MNTVETAKADGPVWRRIPSGIWALGFVSLLMDVSSEMIHALLPVYLVVGLGATALTVGIIEGIAVVPPVSPDTRLLGLGSDELPWGAHPER